MLRTAFGPAIARFLEDTAIIEVMLNPDGRLWIDRLSGGLAETGAELEYLFSSTAAQTALAENYVELPY